MHKGDGQQKKRLDGAGAESKAGGEAFYIPYMSGVEEGGEVKEEQDGKNENHLQCILEQLSIPPPPSLPGQGGQLDSHIHTPTSSHHREP